MTRSIDVDSFDPTIEEKIFYRAKRVCIVLALAALTLGGLDLMNIRSAESVAALMHENGLNIGDLSDRIRSEIGGISLASASPSITIEIPRGAFAGNPRMAPAPIAAEDDSSVAAALAALRRRDAVADAMQPPPAGMKSPLRVARESAAGAPPATLQLASIDPGALPASANGPAQAPVSLPMSTAVAPGMVPMPHPAPAAPPPSPAQRLHLEGKERAKAERCLANAIYFESRGEPERGQMAVAQVVINRVFSGFYPNDVCSVVYQNASRHLACQFTFACDGRSKSVNERGAWARANRIAKQTLDGEIYVPEVAKSTHYHAIYVHPNWVGEMKKMVRYGIHNFYRPNAWGNGAEEPVWGNGAVVEKKK